MPRRAGSRACSSASWSSSQAPRTPATSTGSEGITPAERQRLEQRLAEPTVWDAFVAVLGQRGLPADDDDQIAESVRATAHDREQHAAVWALAEALLQHDELAASWRARHVVMVERMIGSKSGTGGSSGSAYLRGRLPLQYFPVLWDVRSRL